MLGADEGVDSRKAASPRHTVQDSRRKREASKLRVQVGLYRTSVSQPAVYQRLIFKKPNSTSLLSSCKSSQCVAMLKPHMSRCGQTGPVGGCERHVGGAD